VDLVSCIILRDLMVRLLRPVFPMMLRRPALHHRYCYASAFLLNDEK